MTKVLLATDADWIRDEVEAALEDDETSLARVRAGEHVLTAAQSIEPDLVILDLQIGNMGGFATTLLLLQEIESERLDPFRILLLLDRDADVFLAQTSQAHGWLLKPIDSFRLRRASRRLLAGETSFEMPETHTTAIPS